MIYIIMELRRKTRFLAGTSFFWQERHPTLRKISFEPSIRLFYIYTLTMRPSLRGFAEGCLSSERA